ncbi:MAG TPA: 50S ribosomal protein L25 [Patescibacteria group bacterium]
MDITLNTQVRKVTGRKVKALRKEGIVPGNIYGKNVTSEAVSVDEKEFLSAFEKVGETGILNLKVGKTTRPVLVHNIQAHAVSGKPLHVDFMQVNLKEKITAQVPVELVGESPAQKSGLGTVVLLLGELEVESLPTDIPEKFSIDATKLTEVDQVIKVSDLDYDKKKVEVKAEADEIVVKVEPPQKEEVVAAPVVEAPVEGEAAKEGEKPAEGAETSEKPAEEKPQA